MAEPQNSSCSYVPSGMADGRDALNVHFYYLVIGANPSDVPTMPLIRGTSDTGLAASHRSRPSNSAETIVQLALRSSDFGRDHVVTIVTDADSEIHETNESDNRLRVAVRLPSPRPSSAVDPLPCTITRA